MRDKTSSTHSAITNERNSPNAMRKNNHRYQGSCSKISRAPQARSHQTLSKIEMKGMNGTNSMKYSMNMTSLMFPLSPRKIN
jgi:hypothetical protein